MEKATITRVRSSEFRSKDRPKIQRQRFTIYGTVDKVSSTNSSILIARGDKGTTFWAEHTKDSNIFNIGDKYKFEITFSTFISKTDDMIKTKIWIEEATPITDDEELKKGFEDGHMAVDILNSVRTDIPNLFILEMKRMEEGESKETYFMRFGSKDSSLPGTGKAIVKFELRKSKDLITSKGELFTDVAKREYIDSDGNEVRVETALYHPALTIKDIIK